jgi:hypothetical protein
VYNKYIEIDKVKTGEDPFLFIFSVKLAYLSHKKFLKGFNQGLRGEEFI